MAKELREKRRSARDLLAAYDWAMANPEEALRSCKHSRDVKKSLVRASEIFLIVLEIVNSGEYPLERAQALEDVGDCQWRLEQRYKAIKNMQRCLEIRELELGEHHEQTERAASKLKTFLAPSIELPSVEGEASGSTEPGGPLPR